MSDLELLLEKVRTAEVGSRELDLEFWRLFDPKAPEIEAAGKEPLPWLWMVTTSIDAIVALIERELPGWVVADLCQNSRHAGDPWGSTLAVYFGSTPSKNKSASSGHDFPSAPLALCAAFLSAKIQTGSGETGE